MFETSLEESIEVLSKSELIDSESQRGVFTCLLYTSDAADESVGVGLVGSEMCIRDRLN